MMRQEKVVFDNVFLVSGKNPSNDLLRVPAWQRPHHKFAE